MNKINPKLNFFIIFVLLALSFIIIIGGGYSVYVLAAYSRLEDNLNLSIENSIENVIDLNKEYNISTYDFAYGAFSNKYSSHFEKSKTISGKKLQGEYATARILDEVILNTIANIKILEDLTSDFYFVQQVDVDSDRTFNYNQHEKICEYLPLYSSVYSQNYHTPYMFFPFNNHLGKINSSGIVTFSKYKISQAERYSLPSVDKFFIKSFAKDNSFLATHIPISNGKELILINIHLNENDITQLSIINEYAKKEYEKGNYIIIGGNFNADIANSNSLFKTTEEKTLQAKQITQEHIYDFLSFAQISASENELIPTFRSGAMPYEKDKSYTAITDGFIISNNITLISQTVNDYKFNYSNHNPVSMIFKLA